MDSTVAAAIIGSIAVILAALIGLIATRRKSADLRLVDTLIEEFSPRGLILGLGALLAPVNVFPHIVVKLRNAGTEVVVLKRVEFRIMKGGFLFPLRRPEPLTKSSTEGAETPPRSDYDVEFADGMASWRSGGWTEAMNLSRTIPPNTADEFTFRIIGDWEGTTLCYIQIILRYNEDKILSSKKIILPLVAPSIYRGLNYLENAEETAQKNYEIIQEFRRLRGTRSEIADVILSFRGNGIWVIIPN
ncbi:MAG: hypothetical protein EYC68_07065 [Chloroflexota bacterium]|nr:MAG: hypothetical protein EYC68_07065 [Chloroflexota bacterium]